MVCTVLGAKKMEFVNDNKETVKVSKLYVSHKAPLPDENTKYRGQACSEVSFPYDVVDEIPLGAKLLLDFDKKGKLLDYEVMDVPKEVKK